MKTFRKYGALLPAFLLAAACILNGCGSERENEPTSLSSEQEDESLTISSEQESEPLVLTFEATDMEGNAVTGDILTGVELTMVNVWATYCNPCLREMPDLGELAGEYESDEFQIIGIVSDVAAWDSEETIASAAKLAEETGADYTHLLLNQSLYDALLTDVYGVPTTFFIDQKGNILETIVGSNDKAFWKEKIDGYLEDL